MKFKFGDKVKFLDEIWEEKRILGTDMGFFGRPMAENDPNEFTVFSGSEQDENSVEYQIIGFPFLVWEEELELIV